MDILYILRYLIIFKKTDLKNIHYIYIKMNQIELNAEIEVIKRRGRKPKPENEKKTANLRAYHAEYHKNRGDKYLNHQNKRRKTEHLLKNFNIQKEFIDKYKNDLGNLVRIHQLIEELESGVWEQFLNDKYNFIYSKKS